MKTSTRPTGPVVVLITMGRSGHDDRLAPIARELVRQGADLHVVANADSAELWRSMGATFVDQFADGTVDDADPTTVPLPARLVTFAARFGKQLAHRLAVIQPRMIVHDSMAVVAWVVAQELGIPRVTLCARISFLDESAWDDRAQRGFLTISDECHAAVEDLRAQGLPDASPYSFLNIRSDCLNVYAEPAQFLTSAERSVLEPVMFSGSLDLDRAPRPSEARQFEATTDSMIRVYLSFGTVIWRYYIREASDLIRAVAAVTQADKRLLTLISVGRSQIGPSLADLNGPRVQVVDFVDQWQVLTETEIFITHHGLKSTHEAIYRGVPMIGGPFQTDQPDLSERCAALGLSVPLIRDGDLSKTADDVLAAIEEVIERRETILQRLAEAREWELEAIAARPAIARRMIDIAG